ncbi:DUF4446 family protein [Lagierella sp.]|uniref:DUF4446 family protein n=1 Tax=Lagierella sp. TaxID=2849657 RepID=UPI00262A4330|nr:DUF4446 family protein [Lagierella sp.]
METFKTIVQTGSFFLFILLAFLMFVAFSNMFKLNRKVNRLKRRYDNILKGRGELNLEEILLAHSEDIEKIVISQGQIKSRQEQLEDVIKNSIQKVGYHKYDAFPELRNKLSFTLVLMDRDDTGLMLTSIYGRDSSVTFSKRIERGKVTEEISQEEQIALERALKTK